jgi:endonuclease/exonuclease/phosphatase family metal-dependent hydrolase
MGRRRTRWLAFSVVLALLAAMNGTASAGDRGVGPDREVTVMTRNLYFGADLEPVLTAGDETAFNNALLAALVQALGVPGTPDLGSNPWARMGAVAAEIEATGAVLVGLQETAIWTVDGVVVADFAQLIVDGLQARGLEYQVVASHPGFQFGATIGGLSASLGISDVIIARTDLPTSQLKLSNPQGANYAAVLPLPLPTGDILPFRRQWVSVDAKVRGKEFRFVSTHLESVNPFTRAAQATELVSSPASPLNTTDDPVVLVGDLNSEVGVQPFTGFTDAADIVLDAGFTDAWAVAGSGPGFTFGHDADLADVNDDLDDSRIDYVMYRGETVAEAAFVVDTDLGLDRPRWPSDHGGVVATMELKVK